MQVRNLSAYLLKAVGFWQKRKGSAEDEIHDEVAKFAKIRPMRVEMYCIHWNG